MAIGGLLMKLHLALCSLRRRQQFIKFVDISLLWVQRLIPMVLVIMGIPQLLFIDKVIDDPVVLVVRVPRVPSWMRQSCSHGCTR